MLKLSRREDCCGCCACAAACPYGAIRMVQDGMGFRYPEIDKDLCVDCGFCEKVCAFKPYEQTRLPKAEAIRFPDYLDKSQSGGLGYALMRKAILEGMIVYGAAMDEDFVVRHRRVDTIEGLEPLRLSKYVQSDMDGIPAQVLKDLKEGRKVLFTGTPCQCAGVGSLGMKYRENLVLIDLICHGAPSPHVWAGFLHWNAKRKGIKIKQVQFRDPSLGWHSSKTRIEYESGEVIYSSNFYHLFINNLVNRTSCGVCPFASVNRPSDLTMGDCWGIEKALPGFADDDKGCSLLLVNTPAGERLFNSLLPDSVCSPLVLDEVLQPSLRVPSRRPVLAEKVEEVFIVKGYSWVEALYGMDSIKVRCKRILHKLNPANTRLFKRIVK